MIRGRLLYAFLSLLLLPAAVAGQEPAAHSAHAGKEVREIKALSPEQVQELLSGAGAGFALPAELNRYPGPRHVLDLAAELALSGSQADAVADIFARMNARARSLGSEIVGRERELDRAFADRTITAASLERLTREIGELTAELRYVHLQAHLETTALLTAHQIGEYDRLRGYASGSEHRHD